MNQHVEPISMDSIGQEACTAAEAAGAVTVVNQMHAAEKKAKSKYYVILEYTEVLRHVLVRNIILLLLNNATNKSIHPTSCSMLHNNLIVLRNYYTKVIFILRFPYNTNGGRRGCCEGRTYSTELMKCCPQDGVKSLDSKCS